VRRGRDRCGARSSILEATVKLALHLAPGSGRQPKVRAGRPFLTGKAGVYAPAIDAQFLMHSFPRF
jgi:hypothetical protein